MPLMLVKILNNLKLKISKGFEQKLASFRLKTLFKVQMGSQNSSLRAIGKPNGHSQAEPSQCQAKS